MKVLFCNVQRRKGISRKTGNDYDICEIEYLVPLEGKQTNDYVFSATGHQIRKLELVPGGMAEFQACKLGQTVDLRLEPDPERPQFNRCVGMA